MIGHRLILGLLLSGLFVSCLGMQAADPKPSDRFTIVIDPGHGGKDPGALGSLVREKDVVLDVALRFGRLIEQQHTDVRILFTRNTDVFIPLERRAQIANKAKADLFVSIHSDYAPSHSAKGASTFTLGPSRSKENFEIAKRENAVILLEENYQQQYEGFDPNSAESYIMFEFMQDAYMSQSIEMASLIQQHFKQIGRNDRGVRQDVFLVLRHTSMPSVLVELGFLTNLEEEAFLRSDEGKDKLAHALLEAFTAFRKNYERKNGHNASVRAEAIKPPIQTDSDRLTSSPKNATRTTRQLVEKTDTVTPATSSSPLFFKVQLLTSDVPLSKKDKRFKGYELDYYFEKGLYKYTYGSFSTWEEAYAQQKALSRQFPGAFVVAFENNQRIPIEQARKKSQKSQ